MRVHQHGACVAQNERRAANRTKTTDRQDKAELQLVALTLSPAWLWDNRLIAVERKLLALRFCPYRLPASLA